MFALEIEFLSGRYSASDYRDRTRAEWPPHPARLFSALVAAAHGAGLGEVARRALLWLETQDAPEIWASEAAAAGSHIVYVPTNDPRPGRSLPHLRSRQPRHFPGAIPTQPYAYFAWEGATAEPDLQAALAAVAAAVSYLGNSRSPVRVSILEQIPSLDPTIFRHYSPVEGGDQPLRVPGPGRLNELEGQFALGRRPSPGPIQLYRVVQPEAPPEPPRSAFGQWLALEAVGGPSLDLEAAAYVASLARDAVLATAEPEAVPLLDGRDHVPHCAWVPLPFVGRRYADGHLLGLAVLLPPEADRAQTRALFRSLARLGRLAIPGLGVWELKPVLPADLTRSAAYNLQPTPWLGPSQYWASATPVMLDRHPHRDGEAAELVAAACERIGLPRPEAVEVSRFSRLQGVPPAFHFHRGLRAGAHPRPAYHIFLRFAEPVRGPVLLGSGRYLGLGLCRPWKEGEAP